MKAERQQNRQSRNRHLSLINSELWRRPQNHRKALACGRSKQRPKRNPNLLSESAKISRSGFARPSRTVEVPLNLNCPSPKCPRSGSRAPSQTTATQNRRANSPNRRENCPNHRGNRQFRRRAPLRPDGDHFRGRQEDSSRSRSQSGRDR